MRHPRVPEEWSALDGGSGAFNIPPCQQLTMSWTMLNAGDSPVNYLIFPLWDVFVSVDPVDTSGRTYNIHGYYTGSPGGAEGTATKTPIAIAATAKYTVNSVDLTGPDVQTGMCSPTLHSFPKPKSPVQAQPAMPLPKVPVTAGATPPVTTPPVAPSSSSSDTGTIVAVGLGILGVGTALWYAFR